MTGDRIEILLTTRTCSLKLQRGTSAQNSKCPAEHPWAAQTLSGSGTCCTAPHVTEYPGCSTTVSLQANDPLAGSFLVFLCWVIVWIASSEPAEAGHCYYLCQHRGQNGEVLDHECIAWGRCLLGTKASESRSSGDWGERRLLKVAQW